MVPNGLYVNPVTSAYCCFYTSVALLLTVSLSHHTAQQRFEKKVLSVNTKQDFLHIFFSTAIHVVVTVSTSTYTWFH